MRNGVKNPRGQAHVAAAIDYVRHSGGDAPMVTKNGGIRLAWDAPGRPMTISLSSKPKNVEKSIQVARQTIRRRYREIGVEVRA